MADFKVGLIGLGGRGMHQMENIFTEREDVCVTYVCDLYEDRCQAGVNLVKKKKGNTPKWTLDYKELIESPDVDVVVVSSAWENHVPASVYAMDHGKQVAVEVGGAYSIDDCWQLVDAYERTGIHCMMLENCCYSANELMVMKMVRAGLFGEIVHCEGGYQHDLRDEIALGDQNRHYRLRNYQNRCCDNYPTHALGPIAKILNINRGNRMVKLTSMASGSWGLNEFARTHSNVTAELQDYKFKQGDVIKTNILCAHGQTICLTLDTTLPHYYARGFTVRGTKGFFGEVENAVFVEGKGSEDHSFFNNVEDFREEWESQIWRDYRKAGVRRGHGGIDWLMFDAYFTSLRNNEVPPIDTYDTAAWMAITPLSEISIANGSMPVDIPDFTRGLWTHRTEKNTGYYSLDV